MDWDALASYDLRARAFARYDSIAAAAHHGNLTFSFAQQPFTSLMHAWLYEAAGMDAPVKLLYTTCFAALIAAFLCFVTLYRSEALAYVVLPGLLLSPLLTHAFIAYTNLSSAYGVFVATWATYATVRTGDRRWCLLAGFLWGFAMWTRQSLEPFVAIGIVALCIPWLRRRRIPWLPLVAAVLAIILSFSWSVYAIWLLFRSGWKPSAVAWLRSSVMILGPAVALSCLVLAFIWAYHRRLHRYLVALVLLSVPMLYAIYRERRRVLDLPLLRAVYVYLRSNLWPTWGPLFLVFAICVLVGISRAAENAGYVALLIGYCTAFIVSTYAFALMNPLLWQQIPGSALRHSYAIIPVFWASIGVMPGTDRIVAAFAALRPSEWRTSIVRPASSGD